MDRDAEENLLLLALAGFSCKASLNFNYCSLPPPYPHSKAYDLSQRTLSACANTVRKAQA